MESENEHRNVVKLKSAIEHPPSVLSNNVDSERSCLGVPHYVMGFNGGASRIRIVSRIPSMLSRSRHKNGRLQIPGPDAVQEIRTRWSRSRCCRLVVLDNELMKKQKSEAQKGSRLNALASWRSAHLHLEASKCGAEEEPV